MTTSPAEIRYPHVRFAQATELLAAILPLREPADQIIERYFKLNKAMGSKDRAFAAETVYGCLRHRRELRWLCATFADQDFDHNEAKWLVASYLLRYGGWSSRALLDARCGLEAENLVREIRSRDMSSMPLAVRCNMADVYVEHLQHDFSDDELLQLARTMNESAPVDLRVNTQKMSRDDCREKLCNAGYECTTTPFSPLGLRRATRGPLFNLPEFRAGIFEMQDEGSQLIGLLVQARPRQTIVDFCAGAGGKTVLLATEMRNKGSLIACDISARRLENMKPRLQRANLDNVRVLTLQDENDPVLIPLQEKADAVLVDAPCSGSGTWRRNPDMKWRPIDLQALSALQQRILSSAARLVRPGGRLVYATCSLLSIENGDIVHRFLQNHPEFQLVAADTILTAEQVASAPSLMNSEGMLQTLPHRHKSDGFFAAVLQREGTIQ